MSVSIQAGQHWASLGAPALPASTCLHGLTCFTHAVLLSADMEEWHHTQVANKLVLHAHGASVCVTVAMWLLRRAAVVSCPDPVIDGFLYQETTSVVALMSTLSRLSGPWSACICEVRCSSTFLKPKHAGLHKFRQVFFVQVRNPSGPLNFGALLLDSDSDPIPPGPDGGGGAPCKSFGMMPVRYALLTFAASVMTRSSMVSECRASKCAMASTTAAGYGQQTLMHELLHATRVLSLSMHRNVHMHGRYQLRSINKVDLLLWTSVCKKKCHAALHDSSRFDYQT